MHAESGGGVGVVDLGLADVGCGPGGLEGGLEVVSGGLQVGAVGDVEDLDVHAAYAKGSSVREGQGVLIGEVARRSGVAAKTLRYYEDIGLIEPPARDAAGYRDFGESVLGRVAFIRAAQAVGLSLGEIRSIVALRDDGKVPCGHVLELLRSRAAEVDESIRQLRELQADLERLVERAVTLDPADCDPDRICHLIGRP